MVVSGKHTIKELMELWQEYNRKRDEYGRLRFGQFVCNRFGWSGRDRLFYTTDNNDAFRMAYEILQGEKEVGW